MVDYKKNLMKTDVLKCSHRQQLASKYNKTNTYKCFPQCIKLILREYKLCVTLGLYKYTNERKRDCSPPALQMDHKEC